MKNSLAALLLCFCTVFPAFADSAPEAVQSEQPLEPAMTDFTIEAVASGQYQWTAKMKIRGLVPVRAAVSRKVNGKWVSLRMDRLVMPVSQGNGVYQCKNTLKIPGSGTFKFELFITRKGTGKFVSLGSKEVKLPL